MNDTHDNKTFYWLNGEQTDLPKGTDYQSISEKTNDTSNTKYLTSNRTREFLRVKIEFLIFNSGFWWTLKQSIILKETDLVNYHILENIVK